MDRELAAGQGRSHRSVVLGRGKRRRGRRRSHRHIAGGKVVGQSVAGRALAVADLREEHLSRGRRRCRLAVLLPRLQGILPQVLEDPEEDARKTVHLHAKLRRIRFQRRSNVVVALGREEVEGARPIRRPRQLLVRDLVEADPHDPGVLSRPQPGVAEALAEPFALRPAILRPAVAVGAQGQEHRGLLHAGLDHLVEDRGLVELRIAPDLDLPGASPALVQLDRELLVEAVDPAIEVVHMRIADKQVPLYGGIGHKRHGVLLRLSEGNWKLECITAQHKTPSK